MNRTVFIHIPRTAGKSIEKTIQSLSKDDPTITYQDLGFPLRPTCDSSVSFTTTQHLSIQSLINRDVFTPDWFSQSFKFAFVRNPWDRLVSLYEHLQYRLKRQKRQRESNQYLHTFHDFATAVCQDRFVQPLGRLVTDDWSQANPQIRWLDWAYQPWSGFTFIGRYEYLNEDWEYVCRLMDIPFTCLQFHNKSAKTKHYTSYYESSDLIDQVGGYYKEDIEKFRYRYDG